MRLFSLIAALAILSGCSHVSSQSSTSDTDVNLYAAQLLTERFRQSLTGDADPDYMTFNVELSPDAQELRVTGIFQKVLPTHSIVASIQDAQDIYNNPDMACSGLISQQFNAIGVDFTMSLIDRKGQTLLPKITCPA